LARLLDLPDVRTGGEPFCFLLNNTVMKDNRIPPRGYTQTAFDKPGLRPVGASYANGQYWDDTRYTLPAETDRVIVTFYYQTASREYVDFLRNRGGLDGATMGQMWDNSKSPSQIIDTVYVPGEAYLPLMFKS
jgi:hypothetical protein